MGHALDTMVYVIKLAGTPILLALSIYVWLIEPCCSQLAHAVPHDS